MRRLKGSKSTMHPLQGDEPRTLRKLRRENTSSLSFVFISEQGGPMSSDAVEYMLKRGAQAAGLPHVHPHMLRHGCGYRLVNQGAKLGHRDVRHTEIYTEVDASRFRELWRGGFRPVTTCKTTFQNRHWFLSRNLCAYYRLGVSHSNPA